MSHEIAHKVTWDEVKVETKKLYDKVMGYDQTRECICKKLSKIESEVKELKQKVIEEI